MKTPRPHQLRPTKCNAYQLAKVGVELVSKHNLTLRCDYCGTMWSPLLKEGVKLPRAYWQCPACRSFERSYSV